MLLKINIPWKYNYSELFKPPIKIEKASVVIYWFPILFYCSDININDNENNWIQFYAQSIIKFVKYNCRYTLVLSDLLEEKTFGNNYCMIKSSFECEQK